MPLCSRTPSFNKFGDSLEDHLLDRFVCGVNDGRMQRRLLAESKLTFATAIQLAQSMETAERDAQNLQQKPRSVLTVESSAPSRGTGGTPQPCYRCAGKHMSRDCRFKDFICNHCGKKGHIARACRSKNDSQTNDVTDDDARTPRTCWRRMTTNIPTRQLQQ